MLAGHPAFRGASLPEIVHAVGYEEPAPLDGTPGLAAIRRVLRRALAKDPDDRTARADIAGLAAARSHDAPLAVAAAARRRVHALRRPAAPRAAGPIRKPTSWRSACPTRSPSRWPTLESVLVRPTQRRHRRPTADVRALGRELPVDVVLTGTLLRAGSARARERAARRRRRRHADLVGRRPGADRRPVPAPGHADRAHRLVARAAADDERPPVARAPRAGQRARPTSSTCARTR